MPKSPHHARLTGPAHHGIRTLLRVIGPVLLLVGAAFSAVGLVSFFRAFSAFGGPPSYFWCVFVGFPLLSIGFAMTKYGFMGATLRYFAGEVAPVGVDTARYVARETRDDLRDLARHAAAGLRDGADGVRHARDAVSVPSCPACSHPADPDATFCDRCGEPLPRGRACAACGETNDPDARFCDRCGRPFGG